MYIQMTSLEHSLAGIELREKLSFTKTQTGEMDQIIHALPGVSGCVLISTCNRTELYLSCETELDPGQVLCSAAHTDYAPYAHAFITRSGEEGIRHLMEVAAGLRSRIWGEDQIISQVKGAIAIAREAHTTDPVLETLFRAAISAGKEIRTSIHLTALPTSAAGMAVSCLEKALGGLSGRKALVIGNGEMGRLAARLLVEAGARVEMTLRTYRHGETIVPPGCEVVQYEERYAAMQGRDLVISATTSPHYTVSVDQLKKLHSLPKMLVDLAIPRDIQPEVGELKGVTLLNIDQLGEHINRDVPHEALEILEKHMDRFRRWADYRQRIAVADQHDQAAPRFPLFIDLRGKKCVVVGGGTVAVRRVGVLRTFGADITVIAPEWKGRELPPNWLQKPYEVGDLNGAFLAIAATNDRAVNHRVGEDANKMHIPVSVADAQEECSFFFPAVCMGDGMIAGLVSDGIGHKRTTEVARAIRATMEEFT